MHGFIGYDKNGEVIVVNTLPYGYACWGCGKGTKGSYNYNPTAHIQFEICQGSNSDAGYYHKAIDVAAQYCAYLCKQYGFNASKICSHREAARSGYASNHGDPESWMIHFGENMDTFRARVAELLGMVEEPEKGSGGETAMETVKKGSKGEAVKVLQNALLTLGYTLPNFGADGSLGNETLLTLKQFQRDKGLSVDGVCGPLTWAAINEALDHAGAPTKVHYTVTIPGLDAETAKKLVESYAGAVSVEMAS